MSQTLNTAIAVIGIDIGKNSFHIVGHDKHGAIVLVRNGRVARWRPALQPAAVPDRHGGLRHRDASSKPKSWFCGISSMF